MMNYCIVGTVAVVKERGRVTPQGGHLSLGVPAGSTVYVNGRPHRAADGCARIPLAQLREVNTVRIKHEGGSTVGEMLMWDGTHAAPLGYDIESTLHEAVVALSRAIARIDAQEKTTSQLASQVKTPLFL